MSTWGAVASNATLRKAKPKRAKKGKGPKQVQQPSKSQKFYDSREWLELRYQALKANDGKCELCGWGKHEGVMLHVDHIKPRSKYPKLSLTLSNLQVLCRACNIGKSNKDETDWRKPRPADEWAAIRERMGEAQ